MAGPWIAVPSRYDGARGGCFQDARYLDALEAAGATPLVIPVYSGPALHAEYASRMDGLLLPGSPTDIDPALYGAPRHPGLGRIFPERDGLDVLLLLEARRRRIPVFGICYGVQSMNVFQGGDLFQDIGSEAPGALEHDPPGRPRETPRHTVRIEPGSRLARIAPGPAIEVNSHHHQAIRRLGRGLEAAARSEDGVVEAIEDPDEDFFLGVQWHPETGWANNTVSRGLFQEFVAACGRRAEPPGADL